MGDQVRFAACGWASARDNDLQVTEAVGRRASEQVIARMREWLKCMLGGQCPESMTVLEPVGEEWWLFHPRCFRSNVVAFALLFEQPPPIHVLPVLKHFGEACGITPGRNAPRGLEVNLLDNEPDRNAAARARLALALGYNAVLTPSSEVKLVFGEQGLPLHRVRWVALVGDRRPLFPPGPGLLLSASNVRPNDRLWREDFLALDEMPRYDQALYLEALSRVPLSPEERAYLFRAVNDRLEGRDRPLPHRLPAEALCWTAHFEVLVEEAFDQAASGQANLTTFLKGVHGSEAAKRAVQAKGDALKSLKGKLVPEAHRKLICALLPRDRDPGDRFVTYHELVDDPVPQTDLLDNASLEVWKGLTGTRDGPTLTSDQKQTLARLFRPHLVRVQEQFTKEGLAWAASEAPSLTSCKLAFYKRLARAGLTEPLARALWTAELQKRPDLSADRLGKGQADPWLEPYIPDPDGAYKPTLEPDWNWLKGIDPADFMRLEGVAERGWWCECVGVFLRKEAIKQDEVLEKAIQQRSPDLLRLLGQVRLIREVVRLAAEIQPSPVRQDLLELLIDHCGLEPPKIEWLRRRTLGLRPLPASIVWNAGELVLLRRLFSSLDDYLRAALHPDRLTKQPQNEKLLLEKIEEWVVKEKRFRSPLPNQAQRTKHEGLVRALAEHFPAWKAFLKSSTGGPPS